MARIFARGERLWIEYSYNGKQKREATGLPNTKQGERDAKILLGRRLEAITQARNPELIKIRPTLFREWAMKQLETHYRNKPSYRSVFPSVKARLIPFFGDDFITLITPGRVREYQTERQRDGVAPATINNEVHYLSKILSLAIKDGRLPRESGNPVSSVDALVTNNTRERFLMAEEANNLIGAAAPHLKPLIVGSLITGGRSSELLVLRSQDVNLESGIVVFREGTTKSRNERTVEIPVEHAAYWRTLLSQVGNVRPITGELFSWEGRVIKRVDKAFNFAKRRAGLGRDVVFHTLRHTYASWYMIAGPGDLYRLQANLGHSDTSLTQRYAKLPKLHTQDRHLYEWKPPVAAKADRI